MKIYTRTGDGGETGLFGGQRVPKAHPRVEAYGEVDELNAVLGMVRVHTRGLDPLDGDLESLQGELFSVGADLATPRQAAERTPRLGPAHGARLERLIDRYEEGLPPLTRFILPAGNAAGAALHLARCVCRRAERRVVALADEASSAEDLTHVVVYLNRLSDLLFVLARHANHADPAGSGEVYWEPPPRG